MRFVKPALSVADQVALLQSRGMLGDPARMAERLGWVNYYRLSAYWHTFKRPGDRFKGDTDFEEVWRRYVFDRELRLLVMDALERVEVALRTRLAQAHAHASGPFGYALDPTALFARDPARRTEFLRRLDDELARSHETFVAHFRNTYGDSHPHPPVWVAAEILSFGGILTWYRGSPRGVRREVAAALDVADVVLESWLLTLNAVRNTCAHHGRLWNREAGLKPKFPRPGHDWQVPVPVGNDRVFGILTILAYCLHQIAPGSGWADRVAGLIGASPTVPLYQMGFPANWKECPIWARMLTSV